jgi:heat shock protein HtpX
MAQAWPRIGRMTQARSLTWRALIAVGLMVGFYALALSIALFLVWVPYAEVRYLSRIDFRLALFCLIGAFIIVRATAPRPDRFTPPGPALTPDRHPRLLAEIAQTARALDQAMPAEVYLVPDANAWVAQRGGVMGIGSRRIMGVGLTLLQALKVSELRAVIAHEFGHYHGGDVKLGPWIYKTREALIRTVVGLARHSGLLMKPFEWYARLFFRVTHAVSRHQEREADVLAARLAGPAALARGLVATHRAALAFPAYWTSEVGPVLEAGFLPPVVAGFARFCDEPRIASDLARATEAEMQEGKANPYDTHPSLRDRLAALGQVPPEPGPPSDPPALSLLESVPALEGLLFATLTKGKAGALRPVSWEEVGQAVLLPRWIAFLEEHGHELRGVTPSALAGLDWVARGRELARSIGGEPPVEPLAQFAVGAAVAVLLARQGFVLEAPPGAPVLLTRGATRVPAFGLRAWLADAAGAEEWRRLCLEAGIADVDLGLAARGRAEPAPSAPRAGSSS